MRSILVVLGLILLAPGSYSSAHTWECFADVPGEEICLMVPSDAPASVSIPVKKSDSKAPVAMVSEYELKGEALTLENEFTRITSANPVIAGESLEDADLYASTKSLDLLRNVETFMKSGPSSRSPDIRVMPAGKRK